MDQTIRETKERRSVRKRAGVVCQAVAESGFRLLGDRTLDVSETGMLIASDAEVDIGEPVVVSLRVPRGTSWVDAEARVARIVRGRRNGDETRAIGLEFVRMDAEDRALLHGGLLRLAPPVPARGLRKDYASAVHAIHDGPAMDYAALVKSIDVTAPS